MHFLNALDSAFLKSVFIMKILSFELFIELFKVEEHKIAPKNAKEHV